MSTEATVYIVDDDEGIRGALSLLMRSAGHRIKACSSAQEFLESFNPAIPGCILLDVRMPGMSGLELLQLLKSYNIHIHIQILIMTGHGDVAMAVKAMKNGAKDFIEKPFDNQLILDAVAKSLTEASAAWQQQQQQQSNMERLALLTPREREVLDLLLAGQINKQVAATLHISVRTVERHRLNCMSKLQAHHLIDIANMGLT